MNIITDPKCEFRNAAQDVNRVIRLCCLYNSQRLNSTRRLQGIKLYLALTIDVIIAETNISACSHLSQAFRKILIIEFRRNGFDLIYELSLEYRVIVVRVSTTETNLVRASRCLIEQKISVRS